MINIGRNKLLLLAGVWVVALCAAFWSSSRYPDLQAKANSGGAAMLQAPLAFEAVVMADGDGFLAGVTATFLNWLHANRYGMAFGLALAAAVLVVLRATGPIGQHRGARGAFLGVLMGAPLGLCVNCAAPLTRGMHAGGVRNETTLALLLASPSLNVIVVVMLFAMLPLHVALLKVVATLALIILVVPLLARFLTHDRPQPAELAQMDRPVLPLPALDNHSSVVAGTSARAIRSFLSAYASALWLVVRLTVPWMLVAGLPGATMVALTPWQELASAVADLERYQRLAGLFGLGLFGLVMPVPVAFDVFICTALWAVVDALHYYVRHFAIVTNVEHRHDVWVAQRHGRPSLIGETLLSGFSGRLWH